MTIKELNQFHYIINTGLISVLLFISIYVNFYSLEKKVTKKTEETLVFNKLSEEEVRAIYNVVIKENRAENVDIDSLIEISKGNKLENKINWIDKIGSKSSSKSRNKATTYGYLFDIFNDYFIEGGITEIDTQKRTDLMTFIVNNFDKDDKKIEYPNLNKSFTLWKNKKKIK